MNDAIVSAARTLAGKDRVVVLTGAGMSQESGIPTFRDALTGLWATFNPEELATLAAFRSNPERVYSWYIDRLRKVRRVEPNAGHVALVAMERRFASFTLVTQNVDGLHRRAGSANVLELHGSLEAFRCFDCGSPVNPDDLLVAAGDVDGGVCEPRACHACGGLIRPGVVWFGEVLPTSETELSWSAAQGCDAILVVGTSGMVYPAADLPRVAAEAGASVIEINPDPTPITGICDCVVRDTAARALPALEAALDTQGPK